jgi:hypothetical protein
MLLLLLLLQGEWVKIKGPITEEEWEAEVNND